MMFIGPIIYSCWLDRIPGLWRRNEGTTGMPMKIRWDLISGMQHHWKLVITVGSCPQQMDCVFNKEGKVWLLPLCWPSWAVTIWGISHQPHAWLKIVWGWRLLLGAKFFNQEAKQTIPLSSSFVCFIPTDEKAGREVGSLFRSSAHIKLLTPSRGQRRRRFVLRHLWQIPVADVKETSTRVTAWHRHMGVVEEEDLDYPIRLTWSIKVQRRARRVLNWQRRYGDGDCNCSFLKETSQNVDVWLLAGK